MKPIEPRVVLTIRMGRSSLEKREFVWGTPVAAFSVGANADWPIQAPEVDATHLFLSFDGYRVYGAAATPSHDVAVDGVPLGSEWTPVAVPSLLAFGSASITIDCEDAGRVEAAPIRPRPIIDLSRADQQPTQVVDLSSTLQLRTVRLELSESMLAELRGASSPEAAPQLVPPAVAPAASLQSGDTLILEAAPSKTLPIARPRDLEGLPPPSLQSGDTLIFETVPNRTLPFARPRDSVGVPPDADLANTLYDGGALRERAAHLAAAQPSESAAPISQSVPAVAAKVQPGALARKLAVFRSASLPKQLTIALLPLAIAGVWALQDNSASASNTHPTQSVSAHVSPSASPVKAVDPPSSTQAASAPSSSEAPPTESAPSPHDSSERLALIAAFSGNKAEAAALYERLASTRHSRVFALAARLTREDRVRKP